MKKIVILLLFSTILFAMEWWEKLDDAAVYDLKGKKVLFIVGDDTDWYEVTVVRANLEKWGAEVFLASDRLEPKAHLWEPQEGKWVIAERRTLKADLLIDKVKVSDYDAFVLPGGKGPENLLKSCREQVVVILKDAAGRGKLIAAICHGPMLLAESALVDGKKVTSHPEVKSILESKGGVYVSETAVRDGKLITGNWPYFASFSREIALGLTNDDVK